VTRTMTRRLWLNLDEDDKALWRSRIAKAGYSEDELTEFDYDNDGRIVWVEGYRESKDGLRYFSKKVRR